MIRRLPRSPIAAGALVVGLAGCVTDHDALAVRDRPDDGSGGSRPSSGGTGGTVEDSGAGVGGHSSSRDTGGPPEPTGPRSLTLVHGLTDEVGSLGFCFAPVVAGVEEAPRGRPWPASGVAFGGSAVVETIEGVDWENDGVRVYAFAGNLAHVGALDCPEAIERARLLSGGPPADGESDAGTSDASADGPMNDAEAARDAGLSADGDATEAAAPSEPPPPPPPIRLAALPVLPAGSLGTTRSYLLVVAGCLGGPAFTDASEHAICGDLYSPRRPTMSPVLVSLAPAERSTAVGLQFLNASVVMESVDLRAAPPETSTASSYGVANDVGFGELAPRLPKDDRNALSLGAATESAGFELLEASGSTPVLEQSWMAALARAGLEAVEDGRAYTLVYLGPRPGFQAQRWWNAPAITLVDNEPLR